MRKEVVKSTFRQNCDYYKIAFELVIESESAKKLRT